jgi:hypothetical protein
MPRFPAAQKASDVADSLPFWWSMVSGQTLRVCPEGKPVPNFRTMLESSG